VRRRVPYDAFSICERGDDVRSIKMVMLAYADIRFAAVYQRHCERSEAIHTSARG
jgi:hypothetical protein